jgi:hypothetical protein
MADNRVGVSLVGESAIASRLHERLPPDQFRIRAYVGKKSPLRYSPLIEDFVPVGAGRRVSLDDLVTASVNGRIEPDDWMVWGSDQALEAIRSSPIPIEQKLALLPAKTPMGLAALGSKAGLAALCEGHGVKTPASTVARTPEELEEALIQYPRSLIKGDSGNSGSRIVRAHLGLTLQELSIPVEWYPVVVQEFVVGSMVSVEALFREGQLSHSLYSVALEFTEQFGLTRIRHFQASPSADYIPSLEALGNAAGFHGFANCSFIWDVQGQRHLLFEVDMRPNRWHQFGPLLGVDWAEGLRLTSRDKPTSRPRQHEAVIHHFPREIVEGVRKREWSWLRAWLHRLPGTWEWRQKADRVVNFQEWKSIGRVLLSLAIPRRGKK